MGSTVRWRKGEFAPLSRQYPWKKGELYTPVTPELLEWFEELRVKHGSYAQICRVCRISTRHFRHIRAGVYATLGLALVDKILTRGESAHRVDDLKWYTPEQAVREGLWPPMREGRSSRNRGARKQGSRGG